MSLKTSEIVRVGILSAIVIIATFINVTLPLSSKGGLVHLGTPVAVICILVYGRKIGTLSSTIGMTLFDILAGYAIWAPITFVARLGFGYILGTVAFSKGRNADSLVFNIIGIVLAGLYMIVAYYIGEALIISSWIVALPSIIGDTIQVVFAIIVGLPVAKILKKANL